MNERHEMRVGFAGEAKKVSVELPAGDLKPWDLDTELRTVGGRHDRVDAVAKVTGRAKYTFDVNLPGMLHGVILRSPHPAGTVTGIDAAAAEAMPGVRAVIPLKGEGRATVRYVGDPVAAVAADRLDQALDALEKIAVAYELGDAVIDFRDHPDAPRRDAGGEVEDPWPERGEERIAEALAGCAHTSTATWSLEVQTHSSLESHGHVCWYKPEQNEMEVWASTQATFGTMGGLARAVDLPANRVVVHAEFIGGGFGSKFSPGDEGVACARLSKATGKPVKLMLSRFEEHTCTGNRPSALIQIRAGIDAEARIRAWDYRSWGGPGFAGRGGNTAGPTSYLTAAETRATQRDLATNTDAARAMRAPGRPQGVFAAEGMLDLLAGQAGLDPLEFRLRNESEALRRAEWELGAERFGWARHYNREPGTPGADGKLRGAGLAGAFWGGMGGHGGRNPHRVTCRIWRDGTVESRNGAQDLGTGMKTVMAALTAEELGVPLDRVKVTMGDTRDPSGPASGGSTTTPSLAPAVRHAAGLAKAELGRRVATHLGVDPTQVVWRDGAVGVDGRMIPFAEACRALIDQAPLEATGERFPNYDGYKDNVCGCQFAAVEVDPETGMVVVTRMLAVQDCGTVINEKLAESQVLGAMIQGISYCLHEERIMDRKSGRMLNGDLSFYKVAGPLDVPELEAILFPVANGRNNVGAAGLGEPPAVAAPAAVANAVSNALGVSMRSMPITPAKVLRALRTREAQRRSR